MIISFLYVVLAILGLSFLIFIHELGHYYMARRVGMRVEVFSIGFGKPLYTWVRDGVKWQIGWLLFGGYVKIAGMETSDQKDIYEVSDGFFSRSPLDRIKVAFMGPFVNIVFAFLAFTLLWLVGGREKNFNEFTGKIGWVDPKSELFMKGVRPGDEIISYNSQAFQGIKDHLSAPMTSSGEMTVEGRHVDLLTHEKTPFNYTIKPYSHPNAEDRDVVTSGILNSANYLIYDRLPGGGENPLPENSPLKYSGIQYGDRVVWMDGLPIYSLQELSHILNEERVLVTIQRGDDVLLRRVPRVPSEELKLDHEVREELIDWQFEAELNGVKFQKLYTLPYNLNNETLVEGRVKFIDKDKEKEAFPEAPYSELDAPLNPGDKILAVSGIPVTYSFEVLSRLQHKIANVIVQRGVSKSLPSWQSIDESFDNEFDPADLQKMTSHFGLPGEINASGNLVLLKRVVPKQRKDFFVTPESQAAFAQELAEQKKKIEQIDDPEKRSYASQQLEKHPHQLLYGLPARDQTVSYNPNPVEMFLKTSEEIWTILKALFTGSLNPKWMSGPVGIVHIVHDHSMNGIKEALYWLGAISLNLGLLNLLPIPVLDGGTICFSLYELISGKRLKPKTLEKLIIPFAMILIGFFIYLTYFDVSRLLKHIL
ncbi:MAG: site-2 protease family protein [Parachlamydia sp.]|jgi:regulator of sigma E protease|nr:site-2 protease family protein [Parachlamydia sp.]